MIGLIQLNMDMLASDIVDIIIEGDSLARGLRFSKSITDAQPYRVEFVNQDDQTIVYELLTAQNRFVRSIDAGAQETFPYYSPSSGVTVAGKDGKVFSYYDQSENVTANPDDVRRISVATVVETGTGLYADWDGSSEQTSAIAVK